MYYEYNTSRLENNVPTYLPPPSILDCLML